MKCRILHESPGRIRVHVIRGRMTMDEADLLEYYLEMADAVETAKVFDQTGDAIIRYQGERKEIISLLARFQFETCELEVPDHNSRAINRQYQEKLVMTVVWHYLKRMFIPAPIRHVICFFKSLKYIVHGIRSLIHGRIDVAVLDAVAIAVSVIRGDFSTASSVMFMLRIGEILEEWTHKKSVNDLAKMMSLNVDKVWLAADGQEVLVPLDQVRAGDEIVVRMGNMIPLDGIVAAGEMTVNQASITGESLPVSKRPGSYVYAGTVVEEGECRIKVDKVTGEGKYDRIVRMIEDSEKLKSETENRAENLADKLVPYSLGGTMLTWLLTRNAQKALSILMVDFSCALKLAMPISVLSAMRESSRHHISVKGGKYLELVSEADTIVFDKTGTLTHASPTVADIVTFNGHEKDDMLRLAACMEEHYPHSIANAIVAEAARRGLYHDEHHTSIQYVVAHGISSLEGEKKAVIGSAHFVFQDEKCVVPEDEREKLEAIPGEYSHIYLCIDGALAAVICIEDPLRENAPEVIRGLHEAGFSRVVMMTGDSRRTAQAAAEKIGVDEFYAEVLPEDKAGFIRAEHEAGRKVIMIGDGVNDSPALAEADVGIAISEGAAIAREVADITISSEDLGTLITMKQLSDALMRRINSNYRGIMGFNGALIALGVLGVLPPTVTALLHNVSTIGFGLHSMTNLLE